MLTKVLALRHQRQGWYQRFQGDDPLKFECSQGVIQVRMMRLDQRSSRVFRGKVVQLAFGCDRLTEKFPYFIAFKKPPVRGSEPRTDIFVCPGSTSADMDFKVQKDSHHIHAMVLTKAGSDEGPQFCFQARFNTDQYVPFWEKDMITFKDDQRYYSHQDRRLRVPEDLLQLLSCLKLVFQDNELIPRYLPSEPGKRRRV